MTELLCIRLLKRLTLSILSVCIFDRKLKMAPIKCVLDSVCQYTSLWTYTFI